MKLFSQYKGLRKEIYYLLIGRIITAMGSFVMPLLTLILRRKLDFTPSQITLCLTIFFLISLPAAIIGGKLTDKFKRKTIIIIFDTITVICYIVAGLIPISNLTIGIVMLAAVFAQIEQPAYDALVADFSLPKDRERAYSLGYLGWNLGFIIGPTLGGLLFENYLGLCFIITGIATFATTLICIFFIHEKDAIALKEESEKENQYE
ncbi:MAG: MFS transporter, partial [Bacilli bacterium]|nr:MFS transporter [Bacilli bacterium]